MEGRASLVGLRAARVAEKEVAAKVHEVGGNNRGPAVREFLKATGLGEGYAWCCAFAVWCFLQAGATTIAHTAGVWVMWDWARRNGYLVSRPFRGDIVLYDFYGHGIQDHAGIVAKVLSIRLVGRWYIKTIEGNTSSDDKGSQSEGDGVFVKRRLVRRDRVAFVRIPD